MKTMLALLTAVPLALSISAGEQNDTLQGDPFRGRELLSQKLCTQCHSVWGHGGLVGPDISTAVAGKSWYDLVGDFWNHTPRMIDAMAEQGHAWPSLDREEMSDLLSYMYYLRLFDEPGDARRGSLTYSQLQCGGCHTVGERGGAVGGPLDRFSAYPSPVILAQAMWNAGPAMQREQLLRGTAIPQFLRTEIADIQAYIRSEALRTDPGVEFMSLPDPERGATLFRSKSCAVCHRPGGGQAPDLSGATLHLTVSEVSGILWNHSYAMHDQMKSRGIAFPRFEGGEFADLISYLHFLGFLVERGDPRTGEQVFERLGCATCHAATDGKAIDLATSEAVSDPIRLSAAMWNHAPEMHELMAEESVAWPSFEAGDMEHLASYLRRLARNGD